MTDRETARREIAALVENYRHLTETQKRHYSEEDVKKDFLLPLFRALGWDVENTQKRNEVRAEEKIAEGYPDYSFRLNGVPVFFLEAKKFSVNIGDEKPMKQAINYSYLKGVTWAVLSDFEGLMVFNADWEERDPIKARMLDLHWPDYTGSNFDDLWLLSRESIEAGEIDRTAERFGRKKKRDDVNKVLFADLTQWRHDLFAEITQMGTTLWSRDYGMVDEAIQRFLDRLIFIRTVEDRRIEENRLRATLRQYTSSTRKNRNLFGDLLALFRELDSIYNARLFAQHRLDTDLEIHDVNLLTTIINGLYDVKGGFANYDFAAIDADVLGAVYEQYLSFKAQDPQGKEALDLSKRSKRKAQGIYYTPKYVVRYIVQQTLGKLLEAPDMTPEKAHSLRILDPACGSGSFLIEAFQVLDRWLAQHGDASDRTDRRARRMRILRENLYGVDLDPQAVEVAQLNLLLQAAHERERLMLLPHIQQGNSLISDPAVAGDDAFDWNERFPEVMAAGGFDVVIGNPPYGATISEGEVEYYRSNFASGSLDTFVLFMEKSAYWLKSASSFGMIVPSGWVSMPTARSLRQMFINEFKPIAFATMPYDVFEGAYIDTIIAIAEKLRQDESWNKISRLPVDLVVFPARFAIKSEKDFYNYRKTTDAITWLNENGNNFLVTTSDLESQIIDKVNHIGLRFSDVADIQRGVTPFETVSTPTVINAQPAFSGTVRRYSINNPEKAYIQYDDTLAEYKPARYFHGPRILLRELISRQFQLQAVYTNEDFVTNKSMQSIILRDKRYSLFYLLGILNSKLLSWLFLSVNSVARRDDFPKIVLKQTRELPLRQINFDDPADKKHHDEMVAMVERMLKLKADHARAEAAFNDRRHDLAHQIERLDKQIDALVYELYGLTADDIAIVEGSSG